VDRAEGLVVPRAEQRDKLLIAAHSQQRTGKRDAAEADGMG
jgi:hypothetical protein